jgi:hypothetical protein
MTPGLGSALRVLVLLFLSTAALGGAETPLLTIASPADISDLLPVVEVRGAIADPAGSLAWNVPGTALRGVATPAVDGSFAFRVATDGLHLTQSVRIVARDSFGRSDELVLLLVDPDPGPQLSLDVPAQSSSDDAHLVISGRVADPTGTLPADWLESLTWSMPPAGGGGAIEVDEAGQFSVGIDGTGLEGVVLWLRAEDRFGHLTLRAVRLSRPQPAVPAAPPPAEAASIEILSPAGIGWYRSRLSVEGRIVGSPSSVDSLDWNVSGDKGPSGEILVDSDGTFRLELATGDLAGDRLLSFEGEITGGGRIGASVALSDGRRAPGVRIDSPPNGGEYGSLLQLAGSVADPYAGMAGMDGFESVSWEMAPLGASSRDAIRSGPINLGVDGTFAATIPTQGMMGQQLVSVVAVGRSGNRGKAGVRVARGESDIPSFSASAGDGVVTLRWDALARGVRCDILYAKGREVGDGSGASVVENVQPPYEIRGLANGSWYVFRLRAAQEGGPYTWSAERDAVPLGRGTLKPVAIGEYGGVRVSWASVPGVKSCEVWRSVQPEGGWVLAAAGHAGTSWFDGQAAAGLVWYYRIRPEIDGAIASDPTPAAALEFAARALEPAGSLAITGSRAVAVSGGYAWVCCGADGIRVIDLGDPVRPREVASLRLPDARAIAVAGATACVADGEQRLVLLDISDPRAPREVGARHLPDPVRSVTLSTGIVYAACGPGGVRLVDISDRSSPRPMGVLASPDARALCLHAGRLLVADAVAGLRVFDLASPGAPRLVSELALAGARGISASAGRAILLDAGGLAIVDLGDPARPAVLATVTEAASCAVMAEDGYAVVAGASGVAVLDAAEPTGRRIDTVPASNAACVAMAGDLACVLEAGSIRLLRVRVLGRPAVIGEAAAAGNAGRIALDGGLAFVAARSSGMLVFEVSEQASRRTFQPTAAFNARFAEDVAATRSLAFVADGAAGLRIVAVEPGGSGTGERQARELSLYRPGGVVHAVSVSGSLACIAMGSSGVQVLDVSDPAFPRRLAAIPSPDARDLALEGDFLLVADAEAGLRSFDLSEPGSPAETAPPLVPAVRVSTGKGWALAISATGVAIVDVSEDGTPRVEGFYRTEWAEDAFRDGDRLIVAEGHRGLTVLDLSDPARPRIVSALRDLYASAASAFGGCVLVAGAGSVTAVKVLVPPWLER